MAMTRESFYTSLGGVGTASSANVLAKLIEHKDQPRRVLGFDEKAKISSDDITSRVKAIRVFFKEYANNDATATDIITRVGGAQDALKAKADKLLLRPSHSHQTYETPSKDVKSVLNQDEICQVLSELKLEQYKERPDYAELLKLENRLNQLEELITKEEIMQEKNAPWLSYLFTIILQDEHYVNYLNRYFSTRRERNQTLRENIMKFHKHKDQLFKDCPITDFPELHKFSETQRFYLCYCFFKSFTLPAPLKKIDNYPDYLEEVKHKFVVDVMQDYTPSNPNLGWNETEKHWRAQELIQYGLKLFVPSEFNTCYNCVQAIEKTTITDLMVKRDALIAQGNKGNSSAKARAGQIDEVIQQIRTNIKKSFRDSLDELKDTITHDKPFLSLFEKPTADTKQNFENKMKELIKSSDIGSHRNLIRPILKGALRVFLSAFTGFSLLFVKGYRKTFFWTDTARILHSSKKTALDVMNNRRTR